MTVTNGQAVCAGTLDENRATTGDVPTRGKLRATISGNALFAVEFGKTNGRDYYLVTVACPSEAGTDSTQDLRSLAWDGNAIISTPPDLDGREMQSDKQPATSIGMNLIGTITFPHPDEDPVNGLRDGHGEVGPQETLTGRVAGEPGASDGVSRAEGWVGM